MLEKVMISDIDEDKPYNIYYTDKRNVKWTKIKK